MSFSQLMWGKTSTGLLLYSTNKKSNRKFSSTKNLTESFHRQKFNKIISYRQKIQQKFFIEKKFNKTFFQIFFQIRNLNRTVAGPEKQSVQTPKSPLELSEGRNLPAPVMSKQVPTVTNLSAAMLFFSPPYTAKRLSWNGYLSWNSGKRHGQNGQHKEKSKRNLSPATRHGNACFNPGTVSTHGLCFVLFFFLPGLIVVSCFVECPAPKDQPATVTLATKGNLPFLMLAGELFFFQVTTAAVSSLGWRSRQVSRRKTKSLDISSLRPQQVWEKSLEMTRFKQPLGHCLETWAIIRWR